MEQMFGVLSALMVEYKTKWLPRMGMKHEGGLIMRFILYLIPYIGIPAILEDTGDGTLKHLGWLVTILQCGYIAIGIGLVGVLLMRWLL